MKPATSILRGRSRAASMLAVVLVLAGCGTRNEPAAREPKPPEPDFVTGIQADNELVYADPADREAALDRLATLEPRVIRVTLNWSVVANGASCETLTVDRLRRSESSCYDWSRYDDLVRGATRRKLPLLMSVFQVPPWVLGGATNFVGKSEQDFGQRLVPRWAAFAEAAARRYGPESRFGEVERWTVGNEPNSAFFWQPHDEESPRRYARLYVAVAKGIRKANPDALLAPGPTGPHSTTRPAVWIESQLEEFDLLDAGEYVDAVAHNAYSREPLGPNVGETKKPAIDVRNLEDLFGLLDAYDATRDKPVWITEFAYQVRPVEPTGVTPEEQARFLAEAWDTFQATDRVRIAIWYVARDPVDPADWQSGLWDVKLEPRPAVEMFMRPVAGPPTPVTGSERVALFGMSLVSPGTQGLEYSEDAGETWQLVRGTTRDGLAVRGELRVHKAVQVRVVDDAGYGPVIPITVRRPGVVAGSS